MGIIDRIFFLFFISGIYCGNEIIKGRLMDILDEVTPCYRLVFVISPYGLVIKDSNILHVTKGENNDTYGDRNPFVMMIGDTTRLRICSAINGDKNHCWDSEPIPLHEDSKVKILQKNVQGELTFLIFINGELKYSVVNNDGKTFKKMKVFVSDKYYPAASVFMKHYEIENCDEFDDDDNDIKDEL